MSNPFAIGFNTQMPGGAGSVSYGGGMQGSQKTGGTSFAPTRTPYETDMADFHNSISNWNGAPVYGAGERILDING